MWHKHTNLLYFIHVYFDLKILNETHINIICINVIRWCIPLDNYSWMVIYYNRTMTNYSTANIHTLCYMQFYFSIVSENTRTHYICELRIVRYVIYLPRPHLKGIMSLIWWFYFSLAMFNMEYIKTIINTSYRVFKVTRGSQEPVSFTW